ncbi:hypothetical protein BMS3Abin03_01919 [bacterium BMS3Abin03]|nr:hypothetical protein BMS3Abin03_01919 [bacterium BMS3Abin03]
MMNGFDGMWYGWFFWIIIIAAIAWAVIQINNKARHEPPGNKSGESPMDILQKRYAKGEITKEEFEKMKKDLM